MTRSCQEEGEKKKKKEKEKEKNRERMARCQKIQVEYFRKEGLMGESIERARRLPLPPPGRSPGVVRGEGIVSVLELCSSVSVLIILWRVLYGLRAKGGGGARFGHRSYG